MKIFLSIALSVIVAFNAFSQEKREEKNLDKQELNKLLGSIDLKSGLVERACLCIDSISTNDRTIKEIAPEIKTCIDKQVVVYQMFSKINQLDTAKNRIDINTNSESDEYKKYYYEIERLLMENCVAIKEIVNANNKINKNSYSENQDAIDAYNEGILFVNKNDFKSAVACYKKAVKIDAKFAFAWDNLGICYRKMGKYSKALEAYKKSLEIDPNGLMPLQNIPIVYSYQKKYDKAIAAYLDLEKIDKNNPEIYYGIGQIYFQFLQDYEKSLDYICKAYRIYVEQNSPYRTDAEKIMSMIYEQMKKQGKEKRFNEILASHNFSLSE